MAAEQFEIDVKLGSIFMPYAMRQRDKLYKDTSTPTGFRSSARFVHYTSAEAALNIVKTKRFWMRNARAMSDYSEVEHGFRLLRSVFMVDRNREAFASALDVCAPSAAQEALQLFDQRWSNEIRFGTYITSISEHDDREDLHGRLSMWRAFGTSAARVAIVFRIPWVTTGARKLNLLFSPVAYLKTQEIQELHDEIVANIREHGDFLSSLERTKIVHSVFGMLVAAVTCLKHEGFREEREWRAIYSPYRNPSSLMETGIEAVSGVPQLIYKIPLDVNKDPSFEDLEFSHLFDRLIIGPTQFGAPMAEAFLKALGDAGVTLLPERQRLIISGIPIRT